KFACLLVHDSILSRIRASTKSGAVHVDWNTVFLYRFHNQALDDAKGSRHETELARAAPGSCD
ncbi:hypothetical protein, partial [Burkholderia thailandensis]